MIKEIRIDCRGRRSYVRELRNHHTRYWRKETRAQTRNRTAGAQQIGCVRRETGCHRHRGCRNSGFFRTILRYRQQYLISTSRTDNRSENHSIGEDLPIPHRLNPARQYVSQVPRRKSSRVNCMPASFQNAPRSMPGLSILLSSKGRAKLPVLSISGEIEFQRDIVRIGDEGPAGARRTGGR